MVINSGTLQCRRLLQPFHELMQRRGVEAQPPKQERHLLVRALAWESKLPNDRVEGRHNIDQKAAGRLPKLLRKLRDGSDNVRRKV